MLYGTSWATLAFRSLSGQAPAYLTDDCQLVAESGWRSLRPVERSVCVIQRCNNTFGDRSFAVAGPRVWNDLPVTLRNTDLTMDTFCKHLKTVFAAVINFTKVLNDTQHRAVSLRQLTVLLLTIFIEFILLMNITAIGYEGFCVCRRWRWLVT